MDWPNLVLDATGANVDYAERAGPLSIKCVFRGEEMHEVGRAQFAVDEGAYLILNNGQRYASYSRSKEPVETFTIFFAPGFAEEVLRCLVTPADRMLDIWATKPDNSVDFFERLYPHDTIVSPKVREIRRAIRQGAADDDWLEEQFHVLLERVLHRHRSLRPELERLSASRPSTRNEIYRRVCRARDFMASNPTCPLRLTEVADIACLSPHHFLRLFKQAFGETPHQYVMCKRLERARKLLLQTDRSITDICLETGFQSVGSFSALFQRETGCSPSLFRRARRQR